ncbi:DUF2867 domain-containing protein [Nocardiopsis salina]|uniref:DUF2867 domain-containing protein n=1 Tax=Nocardiopsis salina TaxID=245836 RepID=UPI00034CAEB9|nr:DUF2867 domain-containing protein [Nocardiopsis salina]
MAFVRNTHQRVIHAPAEVLSELIDTLGGPHDRLWPSPAWVPMRLDRPLAVGADGGHGPIRYRVSEHEPGRRVRFTFRPETGFRGHHELVVEPLPDGNTFLRHHVEAVPFGTSRLTWPLAIRPLHDALIEDLLDNAEQAATGRRPRPHRWSTWVRLLRRAGTPSARTCPVPKEARLAGTVFDAPHHAGAFSIKRPPGTSTDPQVWADAVFRDPPRWVRGLLLLREASVGAVCIERAGRSAFDTVAERPGEVLLGTDAGHLDFRVSVLVGDDRDTVALTTVVLLHNRRGRLYWTVVRPVHPVVVRAMLGHAARRLSERGTTAVR